MEEIRSKTSMSAELAEKFPGIPDSVDTELNRIFTNFIFAERKTDNYGKPIKDEMDYICTNCYRRPDHIERTGIKYNGESANGSAPAHGELVVCPECGAGVEHKLVGRCGKMKNLDQVRRALIILPTGDPDLVFAAAVLARKCYSLDGYQELHIHKHIEHIYAWTPGKAFCWREKYYMKNGSCVYGYVESKSSHCTKGSEYATHIIGADALRNTFLRYCGLDRLNDKTPTGYLDGNAAVRWIAEYCVHPGIEMLVKLGFHSIIQDTVLERKRGDRLLQWKADKPWLFFRMDKAEYNELIKKEVTLDRLQMRAILRRYWTNATITDADNELGRYQNSLGVNTRQVLDLFDRAARRIAPTTSLTKTLHYLDHITDACGLDSWGYGYNRQRALNLLADYYDMAERIRYDLAEPRVLMPKDLTRAHDTAVELYNALKNEEKSREQQANDETYRGKRYKDLAKLYGWRDEHYLVRPPKSTAEIINEGKTLHHCVGGYAARHIDGTKTILFVRQTEAPDTPYFTVEMDIGDYWTKIIQVHGLQNREPDQKLKLFLNRWLRLITERQKKRKEKRRHESKAS